MRTFSFILFVSSDKLRPSPSFMSISEPSSIFLSSTNTEYLNRPAACTSIRRVLSGERSLGWPFEIRHIHITVYRSSNFFMLVEYFGIITNFIKYHRHIGPAWPRYSYLNGIIYL